MDILIVFGSVTADQYQHARLDMHKKGLKPKIVRVTDEYVTRDVFFARALDLESVDEGGEDPDRVAAELEQEYLHSFLGVGTMPSDVKAFIKTESNDDERNWFWLVSMFPPNVGEYRVYNGRDGSFWIEDLGPSAQGRVLN